jgi:hypothetical protein
VVCEGNGDAQWRVFAFTEGRFFARLLGRDTSAASLDEVFTAVRRCLESAPSVRDLREE